MSKHWTEIAVETSAEAADVVTQLLVGIGCAGTVIAHASGVPAGGVVVKGYLRESVKVPACLDVLRERLQTAVEWGVVPSGFRVTCQRIPEEDWVEGWKAQFQPLEIGERLLIQPTWVELPSGCRRVVVWIDPGMAFGTGQHATTQGCLEFLERIIRGGETVLDVGTGSGILAIAAAKLGAERVMALDIDPLCLEVARENVARNQVSDEVFLLQGSFADALRVRADVVVANLSTADVLDMLPQVPRVLKPSGTFIASGVPSSRRWEVEAAWQEAGFVMQGVIEREGWVTFAAHLR
ncbi:MAG: 50S ribosomal protein L11 methyltransferase [Abditibacteriales bacterium]|nr:50S ribosomal protein L11 methyltransferase [Abditibacteriales bacterium]MDW8367551.1 50S ribosomal protein L11 methyltransferase [Abditibacteriales bacterium]